MPKVSVILPVYNCVKYFKHSMESLGQQTFQDFEVIIVDDASYDGTEKQIDIYDRLSPNIRVIRHTNNVGPGETMNDGLVAAAGEYIAVQHADDISLPERLEKEVIYLDGHPSVALVGAWTQYIDADGCRKKKDGWWLRQVKKVPDDPQAIREQLLEMNCLIHTSVMFRKSIVASVGFYDSSSLVEDYDYWLRISEHHDIGIIPEVLCLYRHHHNQLTNTANSKVQEDRQKALAKAMKRRER